MAPFFAMFHHHIWHDSIWPAVASKSVLLTSAVLGATNFVVADILTENKGLAIALAALSTVFTAYFTSRPKVIAALAAREANRNRPAENATTALIGRMTQMNLDEVKGLREEIENKALRLDLLRVSKHNALRSLQAANFYIELVRLIAQEAGLSLPEFNKADVGDIFETEDTAILEMIKTKLEEKKKLVDSGRLAT